MITTMRVATWNLEWAKPGTPRHDRVLAHLESVDADVVITCEDSVHDWDAYPFDTAGETNEGQLIDHVASSKELTVVSVDAWPNVIDGHRITDDSGVAVTYEP